MKSAYAVAALSALPLLLLTLSGRAQILTPTQCASTLDPEKCCNQPADEASRVETARSLLKVNARPGDVNHYHTVINFWAVHGSGEDGVGEDGPVYKESIVSNSGRQEMWDYLEQVFSWSSDMRLVILDEIYQTHPDDSFMYTAVNKWFGSTGAGYYEQPGISIIKFRPGEGCASYQRDYFSEGDTYWGISYLRPFVRKIREDAIKGLGLTDKCIDDDGDGYTKYKAASGCINGAALDCDDYHAEINPGAEEIPGNGVDDDCNPWTRD